jgi:hypothetical protein
MRNGSDEQNSIDHQDGLNDRGVIIMLRIDSH